MAAGDAKIELGGREAKTKDAKCRVRVYLSATDQTSKKNLVDNISAALYVNNASVTEVKNRIIQAFSR